MELLIKLAEEASLQPELAAPKNFSTYTSAYKIDDRPILPPLMTQERSSEMKNHRLTALCIEDYLREKSQILNPTSSWKLQTLPVTKSFEYLNRCNSKDVGTNTQFQPLVVMGRFRQKLQKSETLIYDNRCNAIIKPLKVSREVSSSPSKMITHHLVIEEDPAALAQCAVIQNSSPKFSTLKTYSLTPPPPSPTSISIKSPRRSNQRILSDQKTKTDQMKEHANILDFINVAKQMHMNKLKKDCLQRSNTSPLLNNVPNPNTVWNVPKRNRSSERVEKLHPQLWQRAAAKGRLVPTAATSRTNTMESPLPSSCRSSSNNDLTGILQEQDQQTDSMQGNKIRVKQCMSKEQPSRIRKPKPTVSKNLNSKTNLNTNSNSQKVAASQVSIPCAQAQATSTQARSNSGNSSIPMTSVQRRLNYDPRASLKRTAQQKRIPKSNENEPKTTTTATNTRRVIPGSNTILKPSTSTVDAKPILLKNKLFEMEEKQRQRFQLLVAKQANEQKRLQDEFEIQQQALMERILSNFNLSTKENEFLNEEEEGISRGSMEKS